MCHFDFYLSLLLLSFLFHTNLNVKADDSAPSRGRVCFRVHPSVLFPGCSGTLLLWRASWRRWLWISTSQTNSWHTDWLTDWLIDRLIDWREEEPCWLAAESPLTFSSCCPEAATGTRLRMASSLREQKLRKQLTPTSEKFLPLIPTVRPMNFKILLKEHILLIMLSMVLNNIHLSIQALSAV